MKTLHFLFLIVCVSLVACTPKYLKQYKKDMIKNPTTQAEKDKNLILQYLTEKKLEYKSTESGIYYIIEQESTGGHPTKEDVVETHYKGYTLEGKTFDSSYERNEPLTFPLGRVIKGWQEAIPLLKKGGKGTFIIPSGLAYGERGAGRDIKPNTVLIFDVELLDYFSQEEMAKKQEEKRKELAKKQEEEMRKQAKKDDKLIRDHLADNGITEYQTTDSGIYYTIEKEGTGKSPKVSNTVKVHYEGTLLNGKKFDSSYDRKQPIEFPLARVIQGWQEGIPLLKEGGEGTLYIPSGLAYGSRAMGGDIPANSVLKFKVELLEVK